MTNNVAEFAALEAGLRWLLSEGLAKTPVLIRGDSKLVTEIIAGRWKAKKVHLIAWRDKCWELLTLLHDWEIEWVPREENAEADELSKSG